MCILRHSAICDVQYVKKLDLGQSGQGQLGPLAQLGTGDRLSGTQLFWAHLSPVQFAENRLERTGKFDRIIFWKFYPVLILSKLLFRLIVVYWFPKREGVVRLWKGKYQKKRNIESKNQINEVPSEGGILCEKKTFVAQLEILDAVKINKIKAKNPIDEGPSEGGILCEWKSVPAQLGTLHAVKTIEHIDQMIPRLIFWR